MDGQEGLRSGYISVRATTGPYLEEGRQQTRRKAADPLYVAVQHDELNNVFPLVEVFPLSLAGKTKIKKRRAIIKKFVL